VLVDIRGWVLGSWSWILGNVLGGGPVLPAPKSFISLETIYAEKILIQGSPKNKNAPPIERLGVFISLFNNILLL